MKKYLFVGFLFGILFIKGTDEYSNLRQVKNYNKCVKSFMANPNRDTINESAYQVCKNLLTPSKIESFILWQPQFWCKEFTLGCQI